MRELIKMSSFDLLLVVVAALLPCIAIGQTVTQAIQCYACGLPNIQPDNDIRGSYPNVKTYNHSCDEMRNSMVKGKISNKFVRTCPAGVLSCFGATGLYDHGDRDPNNDIYVTFLGCSEAKYEHKFGCDKDLDQPVEVKDMAQKPVKVHITVKICFCSDQLCNDPNGDLMSGSSSFIPSTLIWLLPVVLTGLKIHL